MENWLPLAEVARRGNIPESTARRYARLFDEFLPHTRDGRTVLYAPECGTTLQHIGQMFADGRTAAQVQESLRRDAATIEVEVQAKPVGPAPRPAEEVRSNLAGFLRQVVDQKQEMAVLRGDVSLLLAELHQERRRRRLLETRNHKLARAMLLLAARLKEQVEASADQPLGGETEELLARLAVLEATVRRLEAGAGPDGFLLARVGAKD